MHHIYHTEGIILGSTNKGEDDKQYYIFTRELGMIYGSASGVRKMSSRLRFILQDFAYLKIDLVQGKNIFRITSASKTNALEGIGKRSEAFRVFGNIARLLRRLLAGMEPNAALFDDLLSGLTILEKVKNVPEARNVEAVLVLRILNNLGYIGENAALNDFIRSPFGEELVFEAAKSKNHILRQVNKALKETHL